MRAMRTSEVQGRYDPFGDEDEQEQWRESQATVYNSPKNGISTSDPRKLEPNFTTESGLGFWVQTPSDFLLSEEFSSDAKTLYLILMAYAGKGVTAFPSTETLGRKLGKHSNTVIKVLQELEQKGLLEKTRRGQGLTTMYHMRDFRPGLRKGRI